jgi:hypothetical protein
MRKVSTKERNSQIFSQKLISFGNIRVRPAQKAPIALPFGVTDAMEYSRSDDGAWAWQVVTRQKADFSSVY